MWAIEYRSDYERPVDVVAANTYYDIVLKENKNWNAPGQFTVQPGQTVEYGETSVLGACPKAAGTSPINLAVYCVVPSGQADQSTSCWEHGALKKNAPGPSALNVGRTSGSGGSTAPTSGTSSDGGHTAHRPPFALPVEETTWECRTTKESFKKVSDASLALAYQFNPYRITFHSNGLFTLANYAGENTFVEDKPFPGSKWRKTSTGVEAVDNFPQGSDFGGVPFEGNTTEYAFVFVSADTANVQVTYSKAFIELLRSGSLKGNYSSELSVFGNGDHVTQGCTRVR